MKSLLTVVVAGALLLPVVPANAAPVVYQAENAVISQGIVESNHAGFTGSGFVNLDNVTGSYVEFTVSGSFSSIVIRYANGTTANRPMSINGVTVDFPSTGAWSTWATRTVAVSSSPIRMTSTTVNGGPNVDSLTVDVAAPTYQAENAVISQGLVESNHAGFTGTGFVNLDNVTGSYVEFTVTGPVTSVVIRYANGTTANRPMSVNGVSVDFPATGAWSTWATRTVAVTSTTIRLTSTTANGGPNVDSLTVQSGGFAHPGVLVSRAQLDFVKGRVAAGAQPWKNAYDTMAASNFASLSWTARPRSIVECGPSSNPNNGCSDEREDAIAAYTHALRWYLTGDSRYATKAIQIMDAWSATITDHTNSNAPLQTGWAGASFSRAAEIIKHTYGNWPLANRFGTMLRNVYLPEIINGHANNNGNWELIMIDAVAGIGVFLDDRAVFDRAVEIWRWRVPAYVYVTADGSLPKTRPGSRYDTPAEIIDYWHGQTTFADGLAQETCRDFGHTGWGLGAAVHVAETARHQGLNLYAEMQTRMTKAFEFHANYDLGASAPSWLCGGTISRGIGPVPEVGYNHYANRMGVALPKTKQLIEQNLRPTGVSHFLAWETLTHALNPA